MYDRSFDELRTGFTAAVSHELRTPLARILALLDSADLPGADVGELIDQAKAEVENAGVLIDEILFLSELESGKEVVSLGRTAALPVLAGRRATGSPSAAERAGVDLDVDGDPHVDVPLRPRMLRIVAENLTENAIRYAGHGSTFTLSVQRAGEFAVLTAADDGVGVDEREPAPALRALLPRRRGPHLARHRARPRDREARRRRGGRRHRGRRRAGPRPAHPLHLPGLETAKAPSEGAFADSTSCCEAASVWICLSVFSDATSTAFVGIGANESFAVYFERLARRSAPRRPSSGARPRSASSCGRMT